MGYGSSRTPLNKNKGYLEYDNIWNEMSYNSSNQEDEEYTDVELYIILSLGNDEDCCDITEEYFCQDQEFEDYGFSIFEIEEVDEWVDFDYFSYLESLPIFDLAENFDEKFLYRFHWN